MTDDADAERARIHAAGLLASQLRMQDGVATYAQLVAGGVTRVDIERRLRGNELRRVHPRVYADHTGPLTWTQRAWAAVLYAEPAYLCGRTDCRWGSGRRRGSALPAISSVTWSMRRTVSSSSSTARWATSRGEIKLVTPTAISMTWPGSVRSPRGCGGIKSSTPHAGRLCVSA